MPINKPYPVGAPEQTHCGIFLLLLQTNGVCTLPQAATHSGLLQRRGLRGGVMPALRRSQHEVGVDTLLGTLNAPVSLPPSLLTGSLPGHLPVRVDGWCLSVCLLLPLLLLPLPVDRSTDWGHTGVVQSEVAHT